MPTILVPGISRAIDGQILDKLKTIAGDNTDGTATKIKSWIDRVYVTKVKGYSAQAPFAVPQDITKVETNSRYFFSYRNRLFSGILKTAEIEWKALQDAKKELADAQEDLKKAAPTAVSTAENAVTTATNAVTTRQLSYDAAINTDTYEFKSIQQHMANGTTRRYIDNGDGNGDISIENNRAWPNGDNEDFWGTQLFYTEVPKKHLLLEEQYYAVLKPYFQYVRLVAKYEAAGDTLKPNILKQIGALFFESARKVQPNGKLPKYRPQESHPIPGIPNITRINKDEIKVYWAGCEHYSYWVKVGYDDASTNNINWGEAKERTGTFILVDAKGQKLHVALAIARYNPFTNNVSVPAPVNIDPKTNNKQTPDQNSTGWSYRVFPLGPSTALPEHVVTMQLFDIDRFRLQLDKQYPDITIFDIFQMLQEDAKIGSNSTLEQALQAALTARDENFSSDYFSVKWEHIDVPVGRTNNRSWNQFTYVQKVVIIHRSRIFDISDQMSIYNIPSVVLDKDEYSRPAKYASVLGKRPSDPDFDVVDRAIQSARTKEYHRIRPNATDNILKKPWQQAKQHFKVHERGRGTFFADFIYLNNRRETEACKRLRRTRRSLDLSTKIGVPVIPKKIIAPFPYVSHASSKRSTTFGVNNYDRMQSYPAVQELPRTFVADADPNLTEKVASTASLLPIDKKMRSATFYNIRVNSGAPKELPHPGYPSRAKATAWQSIVNTVKLPSISVIAMNGGAAVIDDKPIVLEL